MKEMNILQNMPYEVKLVKDALLEARAKYPETEVDSEEITYANGNDSTNFDWDVNGRLCEFGLRTLDGRVWTFKGHVYDDGNMEIYCYPKGEFKPVEIIKRQIMTKEEAENLKKIMEENFDDQGRWDETIESVWPEDALDVAAVKVPKKVTEGRSDPGLCVGIINNKEI